MSPYITDSVLTEIQYFLYDMADQSTWTNDDGKVVGFEHVCPNDISIRAKEILKDLKMVLPKE